MIRIFLFILSSVYSISVVAELSVGESLKPLPVQSGGRVQPFDTFARNNLRFIYGKAQFNKKPAVDILISWMLLPEYWNEIEFIQVKNSTVRKALNLDIDKNLFSPKEILSNKRFIQEVAELRVRQNNEEALDDYFKSIQKLENRLIIYRAFQRGELPGWVPLSNGEVSGTGKEKSRSWLTLAQLKEGTEEKKLFQKIIMSYVSVISVQKKLLLDGEQKVQKLKEAIDNFREALKLKYPEYKKTLSKVHRELHYNNLNPFRLAWIIYLLGFLFLFLYFLFSTKAFFYSSLFLSVGAFLIQGYGMVLRSLIMSRPPVTNMYETVIWVPWVAVIIGAILWLRQKTFVPFICACAVSLFCLLLADSAPDLLDGRLEPLEAVLRSNFWLTIHVLIITMSYSAFFLAFAIGDILLFYFLRKKTDKNLNKINLYAKCIDRSIQGGVVLLAAGTVLGGIWADYSWGRFWGWDPKETWALISLLGYLVLLHGRLVGWIKEFGLAVGSVLVFFLVVMAWYGVNYVLGQGLHSYGFGSGGVEYVAGFALLHIIYVLLVFVLRSRKF